jgi:coenzyme F420-reducing hydrogenase beta subunit
MGWRFLNDAIPKLIYIAYLGKRRSNIHIEAREFINLVSPPLIGLVCTVYLWALQEYQETGSKPEVVNKFNIDGGKSILSAQNGVYSS